MTYVSSSDPTEDRTGTCPNGHEYTWVADLGDGKRGSCGCRLDPDASDQADGEEVDG